jgi:hypothetical protein
VRRLVAVWLVFVGACHPPRKVFVVDVAATPDRAAARTVERAQGIGLAVDEGAPATEDEVRMSGTSDAGRRRSLRMRFHPAPEEGGTWVELDATNVDPEELFAEDERIRRYNGEWTFGDVGPTIVSLRAEASPLNDVGSDRNAAGLMLEVVVPVRTWGGDGRDPSFRQRLYVGGALGSLFRTREHEGDTPKGSDPVGRAEAIVGLDLQRYARPAPGLSLAMGMRYNVSFAVGTEWRADGNRRIDVGVTAGLPEYARLFWRIAWESGHDGPLTSLGFELGSGSMVQIVAQVAAAALYIVFIPGLVPQ